MTYKPPGSDALQRRALKEMRRREKRAAAIRKHGPDLGELEPCPYCGRDICNPEACPADPNAPAPEPLHLIGQLYRRAGKLWRAVELRREPDYSVDPKPYPLRPWQVLLVRTDDRTLAYWHDAEQLEAGALRFKPEPPALPFAA